MGKPIIGVLLRPIKKSTVLKDGVRTKVLDAGGIPIGIAPTANQNYTSYGKNQDYVTGNIVEDLYTQIDLCDALILQGGKNTYLIEQYAAKYALERGIPILGICLGMQNMALVAGYEVLKLDTDNHAKGTESGYLHNIKIAKGTLLEKIMGKNTILVNSAHHDNVPALNMHSFSVSAYSDDGVVEAIEFDGESFYLGVQWHPETMPDLYSNKLFSAIVREAILYSNTKDEKKRKNLVR